MLTALIILGWVSLALLALLILLLVTPVKLRMRGTTDPHPHFRVEARPFGGLFPVPVVDSHRKKTKAEKKPKAEKPDKPKHKRRALNGAEAIDAIPDLIRRLIRAIHIEHLRLKGVFGFTDPANTGQVYGMLTPFIYGFQGRTDVTISPDFNAKRLEGEVDAALSIIPMALIMPFLRFGWVLFRPFK